MTNEERIELARINLALGEVERPFQIRWTRRFGRWRWILTADSKYLFDIDWWPDYVCYLSGQSFITDHTIEDIINNKHPYTWRNIIGRLEH